MKSHTLPSYRWCISFGAKLMRVIPWYTAAIVLMTMVSQLASVAAFFLPLKVVILLGSESLPNYLPDALAEYGREKLILFFALLSVACFLVHVFAERWTTDVTYLASSKLLARSQKVALFEMQDTTAKNAYSHFSSAMAGGVFVLTGWLLLLAVYPKLSFLVAVLGVVYTILIVRFGMKGGEATGLRLKLLATRLSALSFFAVFLFLVVDFLALSPPNVIWAIISLILVRQMLNRVVGTVGNLAYLKSHQDKIEGLFFHGRVYNAQFISDQRSPLALCQPSSRDDWVKPVIEELVGQRLNRPFELHYLQTSVGNIENLILNSKVDDRQYLIRLYGSNRQSNCVNESLLLLEPPSGLPALNSLGVTEVDGNRCQVFAIRAGRLLKSHREFLAIREDIASRILGAVISERLKERYLRSHPTLAQRLSESLLEKLFIGGESRDIPRLERLRDRLPEIRNLLNELPLVIVNPEFRFPSVWLFDSDDVPILLNWGKWSLEPMGAGLEERDIPYLQKMVGNATETKRNSDQVDVEKVRVALRAYLLERAIHEGRLSDGVAIARSLLDDLTQELTGSGFVN